MPKKVIKINEGWNFTDQQKNRTPVTIPHTWNAKDGPDGGNDYWRGTNVYDVEFSAPEYGQEEAVYLQFHGVNASAKVLLNGKKSAPMQAGILHFVRILQSIWKRRISW